MPTIILSLQQKQNVVYCPTFIENIYFHNLPTIIGFIISSLLAMVSVIYVQNS